MLLAPDPATKALFKLQNYLFASFPLITSRMIAKISDYVHRHFVPRKKPIRENKS